MELYCWDGDWGLPSIDIDCLNVLAHVKFSKSPVTVKQSKFPVINHSVSNFPILKKENGSFIQGANNILGYLQETGHHPDIGLKQEQYADVIALKALVTDKIHPYVAYSFWVDSKNFTEFSRPIYAKKCAFPLNFFVPGRLYQNSYDFLQMTKLNARKSVDMIGDELHLEAVDAINLLSSFLGDKDFFFGDRETSFDAMIFSYLAPLVKAKLASAKLQNHVKACDNLVNFVHRILERHFKDQTIPPGKSDNESSAGSELNYEWILPVFIASSLMFMYAVNIGLLANVRSSENNEVESS